MKHVAAILFVSGVLLGGLVAAAPAAGARPTCELEPQQPCPTGPSKPAPETGQGGKIHPNCAGFAMVGLKDIGKQGRLEVYYSRADGGTNCAVAVHTGAAIGKPMWTSIAMNLSEPVNGDYKRTFDWGQKYVSYAGAVRITGTDNKCIDVSGDVGTDSAKFDKAFCKAAK